MEKKNPYILVLLLAVILGVILLVHNASENKLYNDDIKISTEKAENKNEITMTVDVPNGTEYMYSFDGGKTWQNDNHYTYSENAQVSVMIKDKQGIIVGEKKYEVVVADTVGPTINISVPSKIKQGDKINIKDYIKVEDASGVKNTEITPENIDTSETGTKKIKVIAYDEIGNKSELEFSVDIVSEQNDEPQEKPDNQEQNNNNNQTQVTYYRYRIKASNSYECNYYDCSYTDTAATQDAKVVFDSNSYCCNSGNCKKENPQVNYPCPPGDVACPAVMVDGYRASGNTCYKVGFIYEEVEDIYACETKKNGKIYREASYPAKCFGCTTDTVAQPKECKKGWYHPKATQIKTNCTEGEISLGGYCHKIDSYGTYTCPEGFELQGTKCIKKVSKTCSNTCYSETWSDWSEWTTAKISATDNMQVETKVE